jgi:hypothetical protein
MANQVLSRPMFKQSQTASPIAPTSSGIGGITTPDQNAQALKNMFAPTVPAARPTQSFPTPQAGYKRGGEVIDGVAHFAEGGESMAFDAMGNPTGYTAPAPTPVPERIAERLTREDNRPRVDMPEVDAMGNVTGGVMSVPVPADRSTPPAPVSGRVMNMVPSNPSYPERGDPNFDQPPASVPDFRPGRTTAAPPPPNPKDESIQTNLQAITARREASDQQREENKNLALLSAGLGMLSGTSRNAFANIGAGGQQGIATFAGLEKARREDDASRRQESYQQQQLSLQTQQLAQQKEIAFAQLSQDPETVRTYAVLGGATANSTPEERRAAIRKGFDFMQSKDALKQAGDLLKLAATDPNLLTPEQRTILGNLVFGNVTTGVGERSGSGSPPGWGGRLVSPAPTR